MNREDELWYSLPSTDIIRQLHTLASTPFEMAAVIPKWAEFGWQYLPNRYDEAFFPVDIPIGLALMVAPRGNRIDCMYVVFCVWPNFNPKFAKSREVFEREKVRFGEAFDDALALCTGVIGRPNAIGRDTHDDAHRHAMWEGTHGWLILQQASLDPLYGIEVDLWLAPKNGEVFRQTSPLINWLTNRSTS